MVRGVIFNTVILMIFSSSLALDFAPIVQTSKGPVRGLMKTTMGNKTPYYSYKGIPYAKPPTGDLRFMPPVDIDSWNDTLDAFTEGNMCPQYDFVYGNLTGDEDCLYLNIYVPQNELRSPNLATMLYIYGGSYREGYGNSFLYGPDFLIDEGIILVTFNYRLGPLGFLSLRHPKALGNSGLKDQKLVLQWVHQNIINFGGDPGRVTLAGQSAGGASVDFQILDERNAGLFSQSIVMSASPFTLWSYHGSRTMEERGFRLGEILGFQTTDKEALLDYLLKVPAWRLVEAANSVTSVGLPFTPTIEDTSLAPAEDLIITECAVDKYTSGRYNKLPQLRGFLQYETLSFAGFITKYLDMFQNVLSTVNNVGTSLHAQFLTHPITALIKNTVLGLFYVALWFTTNFIFISEIDVTQKLMSKNNDHVIYYYDITYKSNYSLHDTLSHIPYDGAAHSDDIGFLFNYDTPALPVPKDPQHPYNVFRRKFVRLFANYVKFGNPTPEGQNDPSLNVIWPDSRKNGEQMIIDETLKVKSRQVDITTEIMEIGVRIIAPIYMECKSILASLIHIIF